MSNYRNLPGVNIDVKDGQMLLTQDNTTNSMLIIGEVKAASNIEVPEDAVLVQSEEHLFEDFGRYFYQGELNPIAAEWYVAKNAGVRNIYLLGLAEDNLKDNFIKLQDLMYNIVADYQFSHIVVTSLYADENIEGLLAEDFGVDELEEVSGLEVYHTIRGGRNASGLELTEGNKSATLTVTKNGHDLATATIMNSISNPNALASKLNEEIRKGLGELGFDMYFEVAIEDGRAVIKSTEDVNIYGSEILSALGVEDQNSRREGYGNAAQLLGHFAEQQTAESDAVIVYMATKPPFTTNKSEIRENVERLASRTNEISKHVQVIAGPQVAVNIPGSLRTQWLTGVTNYAILVNSLAVQHAPTNQPVPGINGLRYDLSLRQLDKLTGNKYVTFRSKNNRIVVVDGITTAPDLFVGQDIVRSDFTRLSTLRSTSYMVSAIREAVDPFIGRPNEFPLYNAMNTAIKAAIKDAIEKGVIQDAAYSISLGDNLDASQINLTILPQFELRQIDVTIGLSTPSGFETLTGRAPEQQ